MDQKTRNSLRRVVEYLEHDEKIYWVEDGYPKDDCVYLDVARLKVWLENGATATSEELQTAYEESLTEVTKFFEKNKYVAGKSAE
jgi:hypothetical protein